MSQVLVDIGGTSIRLGWQSQQAEDIKDLVTYACGDFATPRDALRQYCEQNQLKVDRVVLAVAAEISGIEVNITNNHWIFNAEELARELGANEYLLINDFAAQAFSNLALLGPEPIIIPQHHILLRKGIRAANSPLLVTGPGTGLGVAALLPSSSGPVVIEGEGGHVSYAPRDENERNILAALAAEFGHVSAERVVSGPGLEAIYQIKNDAKLAAPEIGAGAIAGDTKCLRSVNLMLKSFATVVANAALSFGAGSGIVIAGGVVPRLRDLLDQSGFYERLEDHGRRSEFIADLPIFLAIDKFAGLRGAALASCSPQLQNRTVRF
ncbi:MAG: glucokinase [Alphaproteobacteria bacterium]|nr:glucokinase [Alphaproteobacteria bacterium]